MAPFITGVLRAVIATLIECCKLNAVNPHEWLQRDNQGEEARQSR